MDLQFLKRASLSRLWLKWINFFTRPARNMWIFISAMENGTLKILTSPITHLVLIVPGRECLHRPLRGKILGCPPAHRRQAHPDHHEGPRLPTECGRRSSFLAGILFFLYSLLPYSRHSGKNLVYYLCRHIVLGNSWWNFSTYTVIPNKRLCVQFSCDTQYFSWIKS